MKERRLNIRDVSLTRDLLLPRQSGPASEIFSEIITTISVKKCEDNAFKHLRTTLQGWFPKAKEAWEK
ncbi:MAG: hypothetical protein RL328_266 [Acidobacteriota bacterium]|jgi:hypothetical protein